jgi:hypothetical protein
LIYKIDIDRIFCIDYIPKVKHLLRIVIPKVFHLNDDSDKFNGTTEFFVEISKEILTCPSFPNEGLLVFRL